MTEEKTMICNEEHSGIVEMAPCWYPRNSAIPLTFAIYRPDGSKFPCNYRLKDLRAALEEARR